MTDVSLYVLKLFDYKEASYKVFFCFQEDINILQTPQGSSVIETMLSMPDR